MNNFWIVISTVLLLFVFLQVYKLAKKQGYEKGYFDGALWVTSEMKKEIYGDEEGYVKNNDK